MGIEAPETPTHPFLRRAATLVVASAIPLSVVGAATATAAPLVPGISIQIPFAPVPAVAAVAPVADPADPDAIPPDAAPPAAPAPPVSTGRNDLSTNRPMPDPNVLAPVVPQRLRFPGAPAPRVAPIEAPPGTLRVGSVVIGRPDFLTPDQGKMINDAIAGPEAGLAQTFDSAGFEPSRSDRIAADIIGSTAIGASVGSAVAAPVASIGAVIGAICGAIAGIPMFPTGTVAVMGFGAAVGYGFVASPAIALGAAIGAGVGVAQGLLAPPTVPAS